MQPSLEVRISRGLGICPNKSFDEIGAEAEISKTSIPGQECPACKRLVIAKRSFHIKEYSVYMATVVLKLKRIELSLNLHIVSPSLDVYNIE